MKQNFLPKELEANEKCNVASCLECQDCKVINFDEKKAELKTSSSQLYAKEAENYFFYYALNMKQGS